MSQTDSVAFWMPWKVNVPIVQVTKECYRKSPREAAAALTSRWYVGPGLEMMEFLGIEARDDVWSEVGLRWSADNGRSWTPLTPRPDTVRKVHGTEVWEGYLAQEYDPHSGLLVAAWLRQIQVGNIWAGGQCNCFSYIRYSRDGGRNWSEPQQLTYEPGAPFEETAPLKQEFLLHNQSYPGSGILRHSNGTLIHCACLANSPGDAQNDTRTWKLGTLCFIGKWDAKVQRYSWTAGNRIAVSPEITSRGLLEPDLAELKDGRVLVVWRGSNTATTPGRKWFSLSTDGGKTLGPIQEWRYDDGASFYSPSSIHRFFRHSNGTLYWLGNICPQPPVGNGPRFPLVIAKVDEATGALKRDTVTAIDDHLEEEGLDLQYSNFSLYENRETHHLELFMTNYGHQPGQQHWLNADSYHYVLTFVR